MNDTGTVKIQEFVFRRLDMDFPSASGLDHNVKMILAIAAMALGALYLAGLVYAAVGRGWSIGQLSPFVLLMAVGGVFCAFYFLPPDIVAQPKKWWTILITILVAALWYVSLMYFKDATSVGPWWASLLGLMRTCVYALIAFVFLLPSKQNFLQTKTTSKGVVLFDTSLSMVDTKDDPLAEKQDPKTLKSRQDKVLEFLKKDDGAFLRKLTGANAISTYRFGSGLDDGYYHFVGGRSYTRAEWEDLARHPEKARDPNLGGPNPMPAEFWSAWLKPTQHIYAPESWEEKKKALYKGEPHMANGADWGDNEIRRFTELGQYNALLHIDRGAFDGTNVFQSLNDALSREQNNLTRAIVLFSDGRSHLGSPEMIEEIKRKAKEKNIPIITVGIGSTRPTARIEVIDVRYPKQIQPDDQFRLVAEVKGNGLPETEFDISLEITKVRIEEKPGTVEGTKQKVETEQDITVVEQRPPKKINPDEKPKEAEKEEPLATVSLGKKLIMVPPIKPMFDNSPRPRAAVEFQIEAPILAQLAAKAPNEDLATVMKTRPLYVALASLAAKDDTERKQLENKYAAIKKWGLAETVSGTGYSEEYRFKVKVKKHELDVTAGDDHLQRVGGIRVLKKPLSILLFTSSASKEYQFLRELLIRETQKDTARLTLAYQPNNPNDTSHAVGVVHGVPERRLLTQFPTAYNPEKEIKNLEDPDTINDLASYDVVVGINPDWRRLSERTATNISRWVENGGGLVVLGGPIHTKSLTARRFGKEPNLKPIIDLLPVELEDIDSVETTRANDAPWNLRFHTGATPDLEFLKLDEGTAPFRDAWEQLYGRTDDPNAKSPFRNGFYSYYPVKKAFPGSQIVAFYGDDSAKADGGAPMPYFVISDPRGAKRVIWIGSIEMWRLRYGKEAYHERFWTKLLRYAGARTQGKLNKRVSLEMGGPYKTTDLIQVDAWAMRPDGTRKTDGEMNLTLKPRGLVQIPPQMLLRTLKPKIGTDGIFSAQFNIPAAGIFDVELDVPDLTLKETGTLIVDPANLEKDDTRPDFDTLYKLASDLEEVKNRMPGREYDDLLRRLARPKIEGETDKKNADKDKPRLFFTLENAELIPSCVDQDVSVQTSRGKPEDLWDTALFTIEPFTLFGKTFGPIPVSWVLLSIVGVLSMEWLIRKLLRLA